jgi:DNA-binding transcriptional ArsR family regulator
MAYRVHFDPSPVYELILSFMIYSRRKWTRNLEIGSSWLKRVDDSVPPKFRTDAGRFDEQSFDYLFLLTFLSPCKSNIAEFLNWLDTQSPGRLYELTSPQSVDAMPNDMGERMQEAVRMLSRWNDIYFSQIDPLWLEVAKEDAKRRREEAEGGKLAAESIVEVATGGIVLEADQQLQDVVLAPAVHFRPLNTYAIYKTLGLILYPVDPPADADGPPPQLMRMTRALADESRIRILRFLAPAARSFTEVVAHTGLSKGTVHHHLVGLRAAGLIRTHINGEQQNQERFSIRPDGVSECTEFLRGYIGY